MGILETFIRALGGCTGFLEVMTLVLDGAALYLAFRTYRKHRHAVVKQSHEHGKKPIKKPTWWPLAVLAAVALVFTGLTAWKWTMMPH